jgi:hypothetical protein
MMQNVNPFALTFAFVPTHLQRKQSQKRVQSNTPDSTASNTTMTTKNIVADDRRATDNIVLAIGGLNGFVSTEVQNSTSVLRLKFSAKIPPIANTRHVLGNQ